MWRGPGPVSWRKKYLQTCTAFCSASLPGSLESGAPGWCSSRESQVLPRSSLEALPCSPWGWFLSFLCRCLSLLACLAGSVQKPVLIAYMFWVFYMQGLQSVLVVVWVSLFCSLSFAANPSFQWKGCFINICHVVRAGRGVRKVAKHMLFSPVVCMLVQALQTQSCVSCADVWLQLGLQVWLWTTKTHQGSHLQCRGCNFESCNSEHLERAWWKASGSCFGDSVAKMARLVLQFVSRVGWSGRW